MSSWTNNLRTWLKSAPPRRGRPRRSPRLACESLESRDVPSISVSGTPPTWQSVGPVGIASSQNVILGTAAQNLQVGGINSVAIDPFNPTHVALATVNGGVWTTNNYPNANLTWTTTTDRLPSLAIASIAYSPVVQNLLFAGTGSYSAGGLGPNFSAGVNSPGDGGAPVGLYRSTDGGATWAQLGATTFAGLRIRDVIPTKLNNGNTIFVDTHDSTGSNTTGVYRSDDRGATWTRLSGANGLPDLGATSMIADPNNPNRFYAAPVGGPGAGVYLLDVAGGNATWVNVTSNLPSAATLGQRILLASSPATTANGVNPVYAAVVDPTGIPQGIYRALPFTSGNPPVQTFIWTAIGPGGLPPDVSRGQQGDVHFAIVADPTSPSIVYVAGDRKDRFPFAGAVARGDAIADSWTTITAPDVPPAPPTPGTTRPIVPVPAPTTAPHPDFRGLIFAGNNTILAATDGGIYQVSNPRQVNGVPTWTSVNGNLAITELYQAAVDNRGTASLADDIYMAAAQDNGQSEALFSQTWNEIATGDGTVVRADPANGYRYYSAQSFFLTRRNPNGTLTQPLGAVGGGGSLIGNTPFLPVMTLNQANPNLMLVGGNFKDLYLSSDHADTFTSIGGPGLGTPVPKITSTVTAIAFGTVQIRNAAYVATDDGEIAQSFDVTSAQGNFKLTNFKAIAGGESAWNIAMDPNNPLLAYAITPTRVFQTTDAKTWTDITGTLAGMVAAGGLTKLSGISLFTNNTVTAADDVLLIGGYGGVYLTRVGQLPATGGPGNWLKLGDGLPNAVVSDLRYDVLSDTLVAGTYGRGEYRLTGASLALNAGPVLTVTGNAAANNMAVYVDPTDASKYVVADGLGNAQSFSFTAIRKVVFKGLGGADTITVGSPAPGVAGTTVPLALNITVDAGGDVGDLLVLQNAADTAARQVTIAPTSIGAALGDNLFVDGGAVAYSGLDAGSVQVKLSAALGDSLIIDDTANSAPASFAIASSRVNRSSGGTYDFSGVDQLQVLAGSGATTFNVQSTAASTVLKGGVGNDQFNFASDAPANAAALGTLAGAIAIDGGAGSDAVRLNGTAAADALTAAVANPNGDGTVLGLPVGFSFASIQSFTYDGLGGLNSFNLTDNSGTSLGTPTNPASGIVFSPTGAASAVIRVGGGIQFNISSIGAPVTINGDANGNGAPDVLLVLGTSAPGLQSAYGEAVVGDGRDVISVSDTLIGVRTITGTQLLAVAPGFAGARSSFSTIYVAAGNEAGPEGDTVTVTPSLATNIIVDGMAPIANPGDQLHILGAGPFALNSVDDPNLGPPQHRFTSSADGSTVGAIGFERTSLDQAGVSSGMIAVASDAGPETVVRVLDRLTGALRYEVTPFPGFAGGATVASGDVNGDGIADLIVGAGVGGAPRVGIFNGFDGAQIADFFGYEDTFRGGVNVSSADFNRDGVADIVLGTGPGGGPRVRVLSGKDLSIIRDVFAYDFRFRGGVSVSAGDVNGDGTPDLVTSPGTGGGPQIVVFSGTNLQQIASFFAFDPSSRTGFYTAAGDVDGDGFADIIVGAGAGGPARVTVFSGLTRFPIADFYVNDPLVPVPGAPATPVDVGVRVAAADVNGDGIADVITGKGPGSRSTLRGYQIAKVNPLTNARSLTLGEVFHQDAFSSDFGFGIFVGGSN